MREPEEWAEGILPGALRLPLGTLETLAPLHLERERPVLLYCRSGNRSQEALKTLPQALAPRGRYQGLARGGNPLRQPGLNDGGKAC